ncbi:MAG: TldD/PmbA family protein [Candidatus Bathyarchaeota archaeon]
MWEDLGRLALKQADKLGASYADVRVGRILVQNVTIKNGMPEIVALSKSKGFGVRTLINGAWGFAGSIEMSKDGIRRTVEKSVSIARASAKLKRKDVNLAEEKAEQSKYSTPIKKDPFEVPLEEKIDMLVQAANLLAEQSPLIKTSYGYHSAFKEDKFFTSTEGAEIQQQVTWCGGGIMGIAIRNGEVQVRSFPASFRGDFSTSGYEFFESLALIEHAKETGRELSKLFEAEKCPSDHLDLILTTDQLALQIHESCGHPTELDRVMGTEADYAGTSFLTSEKLGKFMYGSKHVNLVADATNAGGLGTFGYDDEGTKAKRAYLVKEGLFVGYQSSRETAVELDLPESSGGMRADSPLSLPLIRMTNINLLPGDWKAEEIIKDTKNGILVMTNRSWSIDDKRINFQFGTEIGWRIRNGSKEQMVKKPTYMGVTPQFWGSCDAVSRDNWNMWGTPTCGKGVPGQAMYVGHGCGTARFRNVRVGLMR